MLHQQHKGFFRQAEAAISKPSNLEMGQLLQVTSPPKPRKDAQNVKETDDYDQVKRYLDGQASEIKNFDELLVKVHNRQLVEKDPEKMCQLIEQQLTLERHIQRLEGEADDIRWQFVSRSATITFSDSTAQRLLEIQGQIGQVYHWAVSCLYTPVESRYVRQLGLCRLWGQVCPSVFSLVVHEGIYCACLWHGGYS
ncbi:hypothetical protein JB92DRAFT_831477 [Gautieria morchelliformis]|nr:hypothetical protein JB92DRAFT_831477 [Gautieria morchelliformis]